MFSYLEFDGCVVTCGTCREGLDAMEAGKLFGGRLVDVTAYAHERGLRLDAGGNGYLYHPPCHDSLDGKAEELLVRVGGFGRVETVPHCCSGEDLAVLKRKAGEIANVLAGIEGVADLAEEKVAGQPYLTVTVDRARIARHGLNAADVLELMDTAVGGKSISQVYLENRVADVAIRLPDEHRRSPEALRALLVETPAGGRLPLGELAAVEVEEGPVQISREDGERRIGIELNVAGRDIGSVVREAQAAVRKGVALPPGNYLTWGGQFENQQAAMRRLAVIAPAVAALIFLLLLATFGGLRPALLVIFNLPFALAGGVFALWVSGLYLSVPASVGFIVLFGVAVLNGLVLISSIMQLRAEGRPAHEAVAVGCESRLRPVLMTAAIAIFSLLPMVVATGPGAEVQRPLAVVVIGGLITSTLLTLLVLPALYGWFEGAREPNADVRMEN